MATARKIQLDTSVKPVYGASNLTKESAQKASEVLQKNHDKYHIFFNRDGFHNHIAHHALTAYALGASPEDIERQFNDNTSYQRPLGQFKNNKVEELLQDPAKFHAYLGNGDHYADLLEFFHREIESKGWQAVLHEYLWAGDAKADDMLVRAYAGFLHPIIHLGFGIEFEQPAIIAEALAQTAIHGLWIGDLMVPAEKAAKESGDPSKTLESIRQSMLQNPTLVASPHWADGNKVRDGVLKRAPAEMVSFAAQYVVPPDQLALKVAELLNFCAYFTSAAQNPPYEPQIDFFFMHALNCSVFFPHIVEAEYIPVQARVRLVEWLAREALALYASRNFPELKIDEVRNFSQKGHENDSWAEWIARINGFQRDDGHAAKLLRATGATQQALRGVAKGKGEKEGFYMNEQDLDKMAAMLVYSMELPGDMFVRGCGFQEAWVNQRLPVNEERNRQMNTN